MYTILLMNLSQYLAAAWAWVQANPEVTIAVILYLIVNVSPRKDHTQMTGWQGRLWEIIDRASFLTRDKVPGRLKMILATSPLSGEVDKHLAEAEAEDEFDVDLEDEDKGDS